MVFWIIDIVLLTIIFFLLLLLSMFWPPDSPWAPWWRTNKKTARASCKLANISSKDVVCELGSGDGTFLTVAAKEFGAKGIGIEIDPFRYFVSSILLHSNRLSDKIKLIRKNFFDVDISEATLVFVYLVPRVLEKLKPKFLKELRSGTRIISYRYKINLPLVMYDKTNDIYLYKINK